ncbi:MAG: hypothetical protein OEM25_06270 [Gammaproteobacteria bacterium]|nr:hypothetical protein [Gammaproteobacteria bacterium]
MKTTAKVRKSVCLVMIISLAAVLGGCGGGDDKKKKNEENTCFDNPIIFFFCIVASESDGASSGVTAVGSGATSSLAAVAEYEPNNVLNNANIVSLSSDMRLEGSVRRNNDTSDFYIFTPTRTGTHTILLCGDTCDAAAEDDAAYVMIYDQNQTTMASTPIATVARKQVTTELTAGMAYYIEVNGYNAVAFDYNYRLAVID